MTNEQMLKNLQVPEGIVDVVIDTDAYNEIDDQFAISYLLKSTERANTVAIYAAPFHNRRSTGPEDGMEKSYDEILKLLDLIGEKKEVFKGSREYLKNEQSPVESPAALDLAKRAMKYSPEKPLYVVAIGAITDVASALLINPAIAENIVIVWLGGHGHHYAHTKEFNMRQDVAAARVVMQSNAPFVQLPCMGVVTHFITSKTELELWLKGKNPIADYLANNTIEAAESYASGTPWTRCIWDVTAVGWLLNDGGRFMEWEIMPTRLPEYDGTYGECLADKPMCYVNFVHRDPLMMDMFEKLTKSDKMNL